MRIITLHDRGDNSKIEVIVENICTIKQSNNGTYVSMPSSETCFVRESSDQIKTKISIASTII